MEQGHCVLRLLPISISVDSKLASGKTANLPKQQPPDSQTAGLLDSQVAKE
jgi:hypothetical protein